MIGYHAVPVIADNWLKGNQGGGAQTALDAMVASATNPRYAGLDEYMKTGWVAADKEREGASKTLEYAFDDIVTGKLLAEEPNLAWEWSDEIDWEPKVKMAMSSETANRYFQGKENVAIAIARRRIKAGGDVKAALAIIPITKPLFARYRELIETTYPHLEV